MWKKNLIKYALWKAGGTNPQKTQSVLFSHTKQNTLAGNEVISEAAAVCQSAWMKKYIILALSHVRLSVNHHSSNKNNKNKLKFLTSSTGFSSKCMHKSYSLPCQPTGKFHHSCIDGEDPVQEPHDREDTTLSFFFCLKHWPERPIARCLELCLVSVVMRIALFTRCSLNELWLLLSPFRHSRHKKSEWEGRSRGQEKS